jgi:hypothetical protein
LRQELLWIAEFWLLWMQAHYSPCPQARVRLYILQDQVRGGLYQEFHAGSHPGKHSRKEDSFLRYALCPFPRRTQAFPHAGVGRSGPGVGAMVLDTTTGRACYATQPKAADPILEDSAFAIDGTSGAAHAGPTVPLCGEE